MLKISNDYGKKCLGILIELVPCNDMFKVISGCLNMFINSYQWQIGMN